MSKETQTTWTALAEEWSVYWRGAVVLSLLLGALMIPGIPKREPQALSMAFMLFGFVNFVFYPFFLLTRHVFKGGPVAFLLYTIVLSAAPLMAYVWVMVVLLISRHVLQAARFFKFEFPASVAIYGLTLFFSLQGLSRATAEETPDPSTTPPHPPVTLKQNLDRISKTVNAARSNFTDESAAPTATPEAPAVTVSDYRDPKGYFTMSLPDGYTMEDHSAGARSKRVFRYSSDLDLWIIASEMTKPWDAKSSMEEKVAGLTSGSSGVPGNVQVMSGELIELGALQGYRLALHATDRGMDKESTTFALVGNRTSLSLAISRTWGREESRYQALLESVEKTLRVRDEPKSTTGSTSSSHVAAQPSPTMKADDWRGARSAIPITGVMKRGDRRMILVGTDIFTEGDIITREWRGHTYQFRLDRVDDQPEKAVLTPLADEPAN